MPFLARRKGQMASIETFEPSSYSPARDRFASRTMRRMIECRSDFNKAADDLPGVGENKRDKTPVARLPLWLGTMLFLVAPIAITLVVATGLALISPVGTFNSAVPVQPNTVIIGVSGDVVKVNNYG